MNPTELDKYLYIKKTPTWLVRSLYIYALCAWALVLLGYSGAIAFDPFYRWIAAPMLAVFTLYYGLGFGLNLFYRQFDVSKHAHLREGYWRMHFEPTVNIFLPICGEKMDLLRRTWEHVSRIKYRNKRVYVLDDSREDCVEHRKVAEQYGFAYVSRPNKGWMKKAGNLCYAFERTFGEFIAIFDADFAPHPDFLIELLPYMSDKKVGIVQSPQYFETTKNVHSRSALEYGAAHVQEFFYRFIQVARDRFGGAICCGSNAIYRRSALEAIGGPVLVEHSEDAYTGFILTDKGYRVRYVPMILAVGVCPDDAHSYFHQQHRWCSGSMSLLVTKRFWHSSLSWKTKICYGVGFLYYASQPLSILFSFQLFWSLFFYNDHISISNGILFYPYLLWTYGIMFFFPIARYRPGCILASFLQTYSYSHAVYTSLLKKTIGWIPTNVKHIGVSRAFTQTTIAVCVYVFIYSTLVALAIRMGMLHLLNYSYYSVQFWIFYNVFFTTILLWQMYKTMGEVKGQNIYNAAASQFALASWKLKTAGSYVATLGAVFLAVVYL